MIELIRFTLTCIYFMLPGIGANLAPIFVKNIFKRLAIPIDLGKKLGKKRIFGENKTVRGAIFGLIFSILLSYIQYLLFKKGIFTDIILLDYSSHWLLIGILLGLGVIFGDLANSFAKRRLNLKPGHPFIPFDQINSSVGGLLFILPIYRPNIPVTITVIIIGFILHISSNLAGHHIGLKQNKF